MINTASEENNCEFVSSRGILKSCDIKSNTPISSIRQLQNYNWESLQDGCVIYICNMAIPHFMHYLPQINIRFVLVSGDSDLCCPVELFTSQPIFEKFMESNKLIHWFSQNLVISHPKMTAIPIGLDYHTMKTPSTWGEVLTPHMQENILIQIKKNSLPFYERIPKIYSNFHFSTKNKYGKDRIDAISKIPANFIYYEPVHVHRNISWENQSNYSFVASPHGNGLDCHRTWEALCLGNIVIVKRSPLDILYIDLPVLIVNEWSDITETLLQDTINEFKTKIFNYNKLKLNYWIDIIRNKTK
jgi:hypothetical protein